jgi:hypothetical protein
MGRGKRGVGTGERESGIMMTPLPFRRLPKFSLCKIFRTRGNEMAAKVKPVQPTEIKDKKMVREIIEQIRKPISAKILKRNEKLTAYYKQFEQ